MINFDEILKRRDAMLAQTDALDFDVLAAEIDEKLQSSDMLVVQDAIRILRGLRRQEINQDDSEYHLYAAGFASALTLPLNDGVFPDPNIDYETEDFTFASNEIPAQLDNLINGFLNGLIYKIVKCPRSKNTSHLDFFG
ncbi:MAG: hypothetical protein WCS87_17385 [Methylococcaceae bacterium]